LGGGREREREREREKACTSARSELSSDDGSYGVAVSSVAWFGVLRFGWSCRFVLSLPAFGLQLRLLAVAAAVAAAALETHSTLGVEEEVGRKEGKRRWKGRRSAGSGGSDRAQAGVNDLRIRGVSMSG
jgi:hypothetical protein